MSVFKKKNKNGTTSYGYDFRDRVTGARYRKIVSLARTKWDAEQAETAAKRELFEKRFGVEEKGTALLSDFLDEVYLPWSKANKKSWRDDAYMIPMLKQYFEGKTLREISAQLVEEFKNNRLNTPTKKNTPRRPATVNRELTLLSSAYSLAVKYDKAESNPCSKVDLFTLDNLRYRYLMPEEEPRLMAALTGPRAHLQPIVTVALGTGMRMSEQLNGVRSEYIYNTVNRLTGMTTRTATMATLAGVTNSYDPTGRQLSKIELGGRTINYTYDNVYRLKSETVSGDSNTSTNGALNYTYDGVGNRLSLISTVPALTSTTLAYDVNDRLTVDGYDANGNTRNSVGALYSYDFANRLKTLNQGSVSYVYDGDGNRVAKTVGGITTRYLVDDLNPTGNAQVVEELVDGRVQRVYIHGHQLVSQRQLNENGWTTSFYSHDGQGSVRMLTDNTGEVTDNYTYDAFGNRIASAGVTSNNYLYNGEQFDPDLGLYYMRARNYIPARGRFLTMDPILGDIGHPISLHKYMYADDDPVNKSDPSGMAATLEMSLGYKNTVPVTHLVMLALAPALLCIMNRTADRILLKTEPVPGNPCIGRYPRCYEKPEFREYVECDQLGSSYIFPDPDAALAAIRAGMRAAGYDSGGVQRERVGKPAERGPCAGTPGAKHYNVTQDGDRVASIGECVCCEDRGGAMYPTLQRWCAILNPFYE